jgi:hypothetical protein
MPPSSEQITGFLQGITRGKRLLVLIGQKKALGIARHRVERSNVTISRFGCCKFPKRKVALARNSRQEHVSKQQCPFVVDARFILVSNNPLQGRPKQPHLCDLCA